MPGQQLLPNSSSGFRVGTTLQRFAGFPGGAQVIFYHSAVSMHLLPLPDEETLTFP